MFMVCKESYGVGVEWIFFVYLLNIDYIEVVICGDVCCVKLYYLCELCGKKVKIKEKC